MLKLAQTNQQTNQQTNRQGKNNMSPTTIGHDMKGSPSPRVSQDAPSLLYISHANIPNAILIMSSEEWTITTFFVKSSPNNRRAGHLLFCATDHGHKAGKTVTNHKFHFPDNKRHLSAKT
ncbi:hypothetical protein DPMN_013066 [Dreissena polymorpha]|uniref:Uncharacterized protein n=1 Tax=Dreissena polymorpha TaxID=45954 RepID=A0A9D4S3B5_DREPO|nr:hypothetical protein DPMN_013066 [Dreissena polymorpha]